MALNTAALAGDILLESGAEISRVEETINRIARAYGIESCDPFVLSSGFFLTADSNSDQNFAWVRHIPLSATRLDRVTAVNQLSREIEQGIYSPTEAYQKLQAIQLKHRQRPNGARFLLPVSEVDAFAICLAVMLLIVSFLL